MSIESGSRDHEGLSKLAELIAGRLKNLGGQVELVEQGRLFLLGQRQYRPARLAERMCRHAG
ncbi:MAG TPA: hypothetical protein VGR30_15150 [Candidatus Binatia bacterium]|nr:hypothetical protein [Candidatus Binatia bacterium]